MLQKGLRFSGEFQDHRAKFLCGFSVCLSLCFCGFRAVNDHTHFFMDRTFDRFPGFAIQMLSEKALFLLKLFCFFWT